MMKIMANRIILKMKGSYCDGIFPSNLNKKASHTDMAIKKISQRIKKRVLVAAVLLNGLDI